MPSSDTRRPVMSDSGQAAVASPVLVRARSLAAATETSGTLVANANGALNPVDGVTLAVGDRVLVDYASTKARNGIYTVYSLGDGSNPWRMVRGADLQYGETHRAKFVQVLNGTYVGLNSLSASTDAFVIGTASIEVAYLSGSKVGTPPEFDDKSGTPGDITTTSFAGRAACAIGDDAVEITHALIGSGYNAVVLIPVMEDADATATAITNVTYASGKAIVHFNATATAATKFRWLLIFSDTVA